MNDVARIEDRAVTPVAEGGMMDMIANAVNGGADITVIERLVALKERMDAKEAERLYSESLAAAKAEMPRVIKNKENKHTRSRYADLAEVDRTVAPIASKHGLTLSFYPSKSDIQGHYGLTCEVRHTGGYCATFHADLPSDTAGAKGNENKTAIQGFGSSMSYGRRYLTCMVFNIATGDDDDGNRPQSAQTVTGEQVEKLREIIDRRSLDTEKICAFYSVQSLPEMTATQFADAVIRLDRDAS